MDRIWQWAWDRYGPRYSWAMIALGVQQWFLVYLIMSCAVVAFEGSDHYVEAAAVTAVAVVVLGALLAPPGLGPLRLVERWAADDGIDRESALAATYTWSRRGFARWMLVGVVWSALFLMVVG